MTRVTTNTGGTHIIVDTGGQPEPDERNEAVRTAYKEAAIKRKQEEAETRRIWAREKEEERRKSWANSSSDSQMKVIPQESPNTDELLKTNAHKLIWLLIKIAVVVIAIGVIAAYFRNR